MQIIYVYGWAQYLPISNFKWLNAEQLEQFDVTNIDDEHDTGCVLEVDLGKIILINLFKYVYVDEFI